MSAHSVLTDVAFAWMRDCGLLICQCATPRPDDLDECGRCRKLVLTQERATYLRREYHLRTTETA